MEEVGREIFEKIIAVASGERTKSELRASATTSSAPGASGPLSEGRWDGQPQQSSGLRHSRKFAAKRRIAGEPRPLAARRTEARPWRLGGRNAKAAVEMRPARPACRDGSYANHLSEGALFAASESANSEGPKKPEFSGQPLQFTNLPNRYYPHDRTPAPPLADAGRSWHVEMTPLGKGFPDAGSSLLGDLFRAGRLLLGGRQGRPAQNQPGSYQIAAPQSGQVSPGPPAAPAGPPTSYNASLAAPEYSAAIRR